jgi:N-acetylglutamate synthase-like GNAT family acetyltransferase
LNSLQEKKEKKVICSTCNLPFKYDKESWQDKTHPKDLLQNTLQKKYKKINLQFVPVITKNSTSFLSKLILSFADQKKEFFDVNDLAKNKKESEAKVCLNAYHKLFCEQEKNLN